MSKPVVLVSQQRHFPSLNLNSVLNFDLKVTGISGFVGSHVVLELLHKGYAVRGTARSGRLASLKATICKEYADLTLIHVEDIAKGDFTESLKGVDGVIHIASPLVGKGPPEEYVASALDGTLNVLQQAVAAGVNKVVLTSSWATTLDPDLRQAWQGITFTTSHYGRVTKEEILSGKHGPAWVYLASKILAEEAAWSFASLHPQLSLSTINPPFIYGPFAPGFPPPRQTDLGTNDMVYAVISGAFPCQLPPLFCDVRDVARAHVAALKRCGTPSSTLRRYLICGGTFTWRDAAQHLAKALPELRTRLPPLEMAKPLPGPMSRIDARLAAQELGMVEYIRWEETVEDAVQSLLSVEKIWKNESRSKLMKAAL